MQQSLQPIERVSMLWCKTYALSRVYSSVTYQIVKFYCRDTLIDTRDDLLGDCSSVDMFGVKTITQSRNTSCDLVELNALLASIYYL